MFKNKKTNDGDELPKAIKKMKRQREQEEIKQTNSKRGKHSGKSRKGKANSSNKKRKLKKIIITVIIVIILIVGIVLGVSAHTWKTLAQEMMNNQNSIVIDTDGNTIAELGSEKKQIPISYEKIPDNLKNAYVAIEDERFYKHHGVDIKRTASAIASYVIHFGSSSFGGSTITQQLVKNLTGDSSDSIIRKVKEWWKAWQLETCLSKEEILEGYLNIIYVGPSIYGVEAGARYYFNKSVSNLSLAECAFLAGINHSPNSYNPFTDEDNSQDIKDRTNTVLSKMLELGYITEAEEQSATAELESGLNFKKGEIESGSGVYSYHTDALINEITEDIADKYNISETFATNYINMAGLTIHSTQDSSIQKETETEFEKSKYSRASKIGGNSSQAAMVIIDHTTGHVLGCVGGLGEKTESRPLNRATQSVRQTGSSIKPLAVLAPAIDKKIITAASIYDDTEKDFADGYHPVDYGKQLGKITVRRAVESSQNIPFVEIMEELKPKNAIKYMEKMGISTLTKEDESLVLALGGLQVGISPLEMAAGYATIANDGEYIEPVFYSRIDNKSGKNILEPKQKTRRVFSKEVAYILKSILTQPVVGSNGTATYCKISGVDVAAKTGTTDENYDRWLCGFTPYYTAVAWYGYDQNETVEFNNRNPAGLLWANVMSRIHAGLKTARFEKPNTVSSATICAETGKRARTGCTNTYTEYFLWLTVPGLCDEHSGSEVDKNNSNNSTNNTTNNIQEIIQGITNDIDAIDPQESQRENMTTTNSNTTNNTNTTNTNTNTTNSSNTNSNRTNTSSNTSNTNSSSSNSNNTSSGGSGNTNTSNNNSTSNNTNSSSSSSSSGSGSGSGNTNSGSSETSGSDTSGTDAQSFE